ncbi:MAG TPA: RagB/SusD family nutrient uptake outer membrane protein [Sphingobacteriaceae bacterium]
MKKYIILTFITVTFFSCNYMDEVPYDWAQPVDVFSMEQNYERPINQAYSYLIGGFNRINGSFLGAATDDGMSTISNSSIHRLSRAFVNSSSPIESCWDASYKGIHQALFVQKSLSEIDLVLNKKTTQEVLAIKNIYQGEMYALRAWYEFDLLRHYGGYPIINKYYQLGDPELAAKGRSSVAECVQNIVNLCDSAAKYLDVTPIGGTGGFGRMTKGAALAIKAKTLVFAASPLFNQGGNSNSLTGYLGSGASDVKARWESAAEACAAVINLKTSGGAPVYSLAANYATLFTSSPNTEYIVFVGAPKSNSLENRQYPPTLSKNSGGGTVPTQEFVDAFTKSDGTDYVRGPVATQYTNRDPRFVASIGFDGSKYGTKTVFTHLGQGSTTDGLNVVEERSTNTGYYLKKFLDLNVDFTKASPATAFHIMPLIRLADVYLLYAEAMNEAYGPGLDPKGFGLTARAAVQAVRKRAGFATTDNYLLGVTTNTAMRDKIKQERRVELSFEEQRYFDLRRWLDGNTLNKPVTGISIEITNGVTTSSYFTVDNLRKFEARMYLHPIPLQELRISPQIAQNPGW